MVRDRPVVSWVSLSVYPGYTTVGVGFLGFLPMPTVVTANFVKSLAFIGGAFLFRVEMIRSKSLAL
jgi:hypothetical protein